MAYVPIDDDEIDPESPVTQSLVTRLRDNAIAMILGEPDAPRATSRIITPGGSGADDALVDATDLSAAGPGYYEFTSATLTADKTFPWITRMRVDGDVAIVGCSVVVARRPKRSSLSAVIQDSIIAALRARAGETGVSFASGAGGGGGAAGAGGRGENVAATGGAGAIDSGAWPLMNRPWASRIPLIGGSGLQVDDADNTRGGGAILILVNGDCEFDTAVFDVSGQNATNFGTFGSAGSGGGSVLVICNGTVNITTSLTINARGGNGYDDSGVNKGGGGGGGVFGMVAAAFTGVSPTVDVSGGLDAGGTSDPGADGVDLGLITLPEEVINSIMLGAVQ